ncbi:MAG: hypothetical protein RR314_05020 [Oscillospiraceae bacterium]
MAEKNIKLTGLDKATIDDAALSADFRAAEKTGPFWVGQTGFYYRDGLRKFYVPISLIDRAFTRVQAINTHCCCGTMDVELYRLVLVAGGREIVDVRTEDEKLVDRAQALLKERKPAIELGFIKS